jgi:hypothetical protein
VLPGGRESYPSSFISGDSTADGPKSTALTKAAPPPETNAQKPGPTQPARYSSSPVAMIG